MLFKTALKNLGKNPIMNVMCLIQLVAVFLIAAVMVSALSIRYRTYNPVKDILEKDGLYCSFGTFGAVKPGGSEMEYKDRLTSVDELLEYTGADSAITVGYTYVNNMSLEALESTSSTDGLITARALFYDEELLGRYTPPLARGRWLSANADELEMVIPEGMYGADVGDVVELFVDELYPASFRVVGVLKDGAEVLGMERGRDESGDTYRYMYEPHYPELEDNGNPIFLASAEALQRLCLDASLNIDSAFLLYDDPTDEELHEALKSTSLINGKVIIGLDKMNAESRLYLRGELLKLLPIVIVLMILVVVNSVSVSAIVTRRRLKDYAKYYILGLQWKQCALVNLLQSLIVGVISLVISGILLAAAANITVITETVMIIPNSWLMFAFLGVMALYLIFSMIMPLIMLGSTTPKEQLQAE